MKDPYYAGLLFQIEQMICEADDEAKCMGLQLTDSQVRSAMLKAQRKVRGEEPVISETNEREKILSALIDSIYQAPDYIMKRTMTDDGAEEEEPLPISDWRKALETVAGSIQTRRSNVPGSRCYLDFLHGFIGKTWGRLGVRPGLGIRDSCCRLGPGRIESGHGRTVEQRLERRLATP